MSHLPSRHLIAREYEWYSDTKEHLLGLIFLDIEDRDWGYAIMARDETSCFACMDIEVSILFRHKARKLLFEKMAKLSRAGTTSYAQGRNPRDRIDIFRQVVPDNRLHPLFKSVSREESYSPAKELIRELAFTYIDIDGNFVQQFQSDGFNQRLWELYLHVFLHEQNVDLKRNFRSPDYVGTKFGYPLAVEAVTVNPTMGEDPIDPGDNIKKILELIENYMPIKYGSSLYSKMNKKYWDLPHVKTRPLIFAIADFYHKDSMTWSRDALLYYLYGIGLKHSLSSNGEVVLEMSKFISHEWGTKKINSAFFHQQGSENVSAVFCNNSATVSKFNRIGFSLGFGSSRLQMRRVGAYFDPTEGATQPIPFSVQIQKGEYRETWSEGMIMYHNPRAVNPIPAEVFAGIAHFFEKDNRLYAQFPEQWPITSHTFSITVR